MRSSRHPLLYEANTRVWLTRLRRQLDRRVTLDDIPDPELDALATAGFEWVWMLGVWKTGPLGRAISRSRPEWRREFEHVLPDLTDADIGGSCFAIQEYTVSRDLGGAAALKRLRARLASRGLRLMLDFVPNHLAPDHPWVVSHPDYFVSGTAEDLERAPQNYFPTTRRDGVSRILAHGRDPWFPGWPDTVQLNYANPEVQAAMTDQLLQVARQCDGVRCDMAMLLLPEVFERTWHRAAPEFWPGAIRRVREAHPGFLFLAEVYWDLEWTLQQQGFDLCYDKRLYDRVSNGAAGPVRDHLRADPAYQARLARFLENHDEPRAAAAFDPGRHGAAAVLTYLAPGLRFFHQGQREGCRVRIPTHLVRGPEEVVDDSLRHFYNALFDVLSLPAVREGDWQLLDTPSAWEGNGTSEHFIAYAWTSADGPRVLVTVNFSGNRGQCFVRLPWADLPGRSWRLRDQLGTASYDREGDDLAARGLYLDVPAWHAHVFEVSVAGPVQDVPAA
ncbi:MAG: alpha-amylase [Verrucomicrobiae bacterium]|nr:alpha-amylase [Verrucomicrobiae bacterium]